LQQENNGQANGEEPVKKSRPRRNRPRPARNEEVRIARGW